MISGLVTTIASMPVNTYVTTIIKFINKNLLTAAKLLVFTLPSFCTHFVSLKIFLESFEFGVLIVIPSKVDIMKTRLQSMKYVDGVPEYKGAGDVLLKVTLNLSKKYYMK